MVCLDFAFDLLHQGKARADSAVRELLIFTFDRRAKSLSPSQLKATLVGPISAPVLLFPVVAGIFLVSLLVQHQRVSVATRSAVGVRYACNRKNNKCPDDSIVWFFVVA